MQIPVIRRSDSGEDNSVVFLEINDILYVSRDNTDRIIFHTQHESYFNLNSMDDYDLFLSQYDFFRTDRVCIVNMANVKKMDMELGLVYFEDPPTKHTKFATVAYRKLRKVRDWVSKNILLSES